MLVLRARGNRKYTYRSFFALQLLLSRPCTPQEADERYKLAPLATWFSSQSTYGRTLYIRCLRHHLLIFVATF